MKCVAVITVRNEVNYLKVLLPYLISQGILFAVINNDSSDGSLELCKTFQGQGCVGIYHQDYNGHFELEKQLEIKQQVYQKIDADWLMHLDADEIPQALTPNIKLLDAITQTEKQGYNCINFEEFVFLPVNSQTQITGNYLKENLHYYYFAPKPIRLMRAWKKTNDVSNVSNGGHLLKGSAIKLCPNNFILRHYICLSQQHIFNKYLTRKFVSTELERGWHNNRVNLTRKQLTFPNAHNLKKLAHWSSNQFERSMPKPVHYWEPQFINSKKPLAHLAKAMKKTVSRLLTRMFHKLTS